MADIMNTKSLVTIVIITLILLLFIAIVVVVIAKHGRKLSFPDQDDEVSKEIPFPSPTGNKQWIISNAYRQMEISTSNSLNNGDNNSKTHNSADTIIPSPQIPFQIVNENTYIVKHVFIPKSVDELPIKKNQLLNVKEIYDDGWCMAISLVTGEMGVVPMQCLCLYNEALIQQQQQQQQLQIQQQQQQQLIQQQLIQQQQHKQQAKQMYYQ